MTCTRDIVDLHGFYLEHKRSLSEAFPSLVRMALRLLCESAAKDCSQSLDQYIKARFKEAKAELDQDKKTTLANQNVTESSIIQLLHTGAHNYSASSNMDQTLAISLILGGTLVASHGKVDGEVNHLCSPLRYPGGKNCIFPFVSKLFRENDLIGSSYAEPYAGGSGLALRLLFEEYVDRIYLNDLDRSIYAFWLALLTRPDAFCEWIERVDVSMTSWRIYKDIQNSAASGDLFDLAKSTFFLNRTNVSGVIMGGVIGGQEQLGKFKMDARFNKTDLIARIQRISRFKDRIVLSNLDGISFVRKIDAKPGNVFIYLDPPYFQKGADLYLNFYVEADHRRLANYVHKMKKRWMISYDHHDFILNLYAQRERYCIDSRRVPRTG